MNPVLFLDVDGVLNDHKQFNANGHCGIKAECVAQLNRILHAVGPDVILSTAWRYMVLNGSMTLHGFKYLLLTHGVALFNLVGTTERDKNNVDWLERGKQITQVVKSFEEPRPYVVVDDLDLGISRAGHPFVETDGGVGLTNQDVDKVLDLYKQQGVEMLP